MTILAFDLGVSKSVFCKFDACPGEHSLGNVVTHSGPLRKLFARHRPELVVVEICPQAALVYDLAAELGIRSVVADTTQDAWKWRNVKRQRTIVAVMHKLLVTAWARLRERRPYHARAALAPRRRRKVPGPPAGCRRVTNRNSSFPSGERFTLHRAMVLYRH